MGLYLFFETAYARKHYVRNSMKVIIVLGFSFLLIAIEGWLEGKIAISGLLAVVSMACVLKVKSIAFVSKRLSEKFGKLWLAAEVMLFVLVGAAVDIRYTLEAGFAAILMIFAALFFRTFGVLLCTFKTRLSVKERLFCVIAYLPKATVQQLSAQCLSLPVFHVEKSFSPLLLWLSLSLRTRRTWHGCHLQKTAFSCRIIKCFKANETSLACEVHFGLFTFFHPFLIFFKRLMKPSNSGTVKSSSLYFTE